MHCLGKVWQLALHMKLHLPEEITLPILKSPILQRKDFTRLTFSTKEHYCLDGFPKEGESAVITL